MPRTSSAVGSETLAYCTSCKMDLGHVIVAMKGDQVIKVQCKTCKKDHVYKAPKGVLEPGGKTPSGKKVGGSKKAAKDKASDTPEANPIEIEWEKLMTSHRAAPTKNYTIKINLGLGDKISHPNFGEGIVGRLIYPNKVEVIFRTDVKILVHGGVLAPAQ